ncbi:MAG: alpha/beta fold hydrolase [Kribbellaceae bacterium]
MTTVTSNDGTTIAYTRIGAGPAVVLVDGALCHRTFGPNEPLAEQLAQQFTVYTYDRRGRGDSGDTGPYAVEREFEDLGALVKEAGGSAHVYGISSGGALALAAANAGLPVDRLAVFEVPFVTDHSRPPIPVDLKDRTRELVAAGKRGGAVAAFMREGVNLPAPVVAMMRLMPAWRGLKRLAHTLPYDLTLLGDDTGSGDPLPRQRWAQITAPTLVIAGGKSPQPMQNAMRALTDAIPGAQHHTLEGQTHIVKAAALAPVLTEFFTA